MDRQKTREGYCHFEWTWAPNQGPVPAAKLKPGTSESWRAKAQGKKQTNHHHNPKTTFQIPWAVTASREDPTARPQRHTAPGPWDIWPQTPACSEDAAKALPTLTKSRWCFHVKKLLQLLLKPKAALLAPCWASTRIRAPLQTHVHVVTMTFAQPLHKTSPTPAGPAQRSQLIPAGCTSPDGDCPVQLHLQGQTHRLPSRQTQTKRASRTRMMEFSSGAVTCLARSMAPRTCC